MQETKFLELSEFDALETTGGIFQAILGAVVGYVVYEVADTVVERYTGDKIDEHVSNAIGWGIEKVGEGLSYVGNAIR